jgi:hypothetical protein
MAAEEFYVGLFKMTVWNVAETLLYADAKNCPKLKEATLTLKLHYPEQWWSACFYFFWKSSSIGAHNERDHFFDGKASKVEKKSYNI